MLSSTGGRGRGRSRNNISTNKKTNLLNSSSSTSSSSTTTTSLQTKTMEEVWKDIALSTFPDHVHHNPSPDHHDHHPSSSNTFRHVIFQDFLGPHPLGKAGPRPPPTTTTRSIASSTASTEESSPCAGSGSHHVVVPPSATFLSLKNVRSPEFHFLDIQPSNDHHHSTISNANCFINGTGPTFESLIRSSSGLTSFGTKKRVQDHPHDITVNNSSTDRRQKRMIKNRESAARSRARKQAYTNELELEVAFLMEENAKLRRQQEQLRLAAQPQVPKKRTLQRTSTAPF